MNILFWLLVLSVIENGVLAGVSFDVAFVKLPTRKRIGAVAYAQFARGNDLGNGKIVYPLLGILAVIIVIGTTLFAWITHAPLQVLVPLVIASFFTLLHSFFTAKAAPIMLSLAKTPDDVKILSKKLDRFAFWHGFRAVFQLITFIVVLWALVAY